MQPSNDELLKLSKRDFRAYIDAGIDMLEDWLGRHFSGAGRSMWRPRSDLL